MCKITIEIQLQVVYSCIKNISYIKRRGIMELLEKIRQAADTLTQEETMEVLRYIKEIKQNRA